MAHEHEGETYAFGGRAAYVASTALRNGQVVDGGRQVPTVPESSTLSDSHRTGHRPAIGAARAGYAGETELCSAGRAKHRGPGSSDEQLPGPTLTMDRSVLPCAPTMLAYLGGTPIRGHGRIERGN